MFVRLRGDNVYNVLFENSEGKKRIIGIAKTEKTAFKIIDDFLKEHNYKSYYKRTWKTDDKTTCLDVGSWSERFYIKEM